MHKMRIFLVITCYILPHSLGVELLNHDLGDLHIDARAGRLPQKYYPLTEQDQNAAQKIIDLVDLIQLAPDIDPFVRATLKPLGIDIDLLWLKGHVFMKNLVVAGIKKLKVNAIEMRLKNYRIDLNISFPSIYVEGDFNVQARWGYFPMSCRTHLSTLLTGLDISVIAGGIATHARPTGRVLQITAADLKLDVQNILLNFTNLQFGGSHEEVGLAVAQVFKGRQKGNMFDRLVITALKMINKQLLNVSLDAFETYLLTTGY